MAESARDLVRKLGTFLADLTHDRPADRIHADILDRLRDPDLPLDHRLAGVYLQDRDFVPIWTAIRNGASLPASSWETVVLPTVVHFSTAQALKANIETAIGLWRVARDAVSAPLPIEPAAATTTTTTTTLTPAVPLLVEVPEPEPEIIPWGAPGGEPDPPRRRMRLWVPSAAGLTLVAVAAIALVNYPEPAAIPGPLPSTHVFPDPPAPSPVPSEEPSPSPSAEPTGLAPAAPTNSSMRTLAPSAPRSLAHTAKTRTSVTLSWRAPAELGTGGLDRYRIYANGQEVASTTGTTDTVINLTPGTSYTFSVKAFSRMGRESPESNTITVRTDDPALNAPPTVPYAQSFDISGAGWPCQTVDVYLGPHLVVRPKTEANSFSDTIYVDPDGLVKDVNGASFHLYSGSWQMRATCSGLTQTRTIAVGPKSVDPSPPETQS
ncbi:fibronectin type III domain-containing protein [Allorhizocola rhizosphaerae]|uniref:fibronectin type III domain-containing protein n=1 Tax=Allorhizocola rhizosphaerae TaxID=1872709 RepID=UPI000E3DBAA2|nr:fibronectin type III domain-containing protein [Allorhizocola rhizosphaerae]